MAVVHQTNVKVMARILDGHSAAVAAAVARATRRAAEKHRTEVAQATPVDTGILRRAWGVTTLPGLVVLENDAPYSSIVEAGRRRGKWPPGTYNHEAKRLTSGPIFEWLARKRRVSNAKALVGKRGKSRADAKAAAQFDLARVAYLIARAITMRGIKPKWLVRQRLSKWRDEVAAGVQAELDRRGK